MQPESLKSAYKEPKYKRFPKSEEKEEQKESRLKKGQDYYLSELKDGAIARHKTK